MKHKSSWQVLNFKNEFKFEPVSSFSVTWRFEWSLICFQDWKKFRLARTRTYKSFKSKHSIYGSENNWKTESQHWTVRDSNGVATSLSEIIFVDWFKFSEKWDPILMISIFVSDIGSRHFKVNLKVIIFWFASDF